jgi:hypothetical protein
MHVHVRISLFVIVLFWSTSPTPRLPRFTFARDVFVFGNSFLLLFCFDPRRQHLDCHVSHLPSARDKHVCERATASWVNVERYHGAVPGYLADRKKGSFVPPTPRLPHFIFALGVG